MHIIMGRVRRETPARLSGVMPGAPRRTALHPARPNGAAAQTLPAAAQTPAVSQHPRTAPKHAAPRRRPPQPGGKHTPAAAVFALLAAAFAATAFAGLHLGADTVPKTALKAAVLSAQLSYPQGGQTVAAREWQKLRAWFAASGGTAQTASAASAAASGSASQ